MFIGRDEIIGKINHYSRRGEPFIFCIDFAAERGFVLPPDEALKQGIAWSFPGEETPGVPFSGSFRFIPHPVTPERYREAFELVMHHLQRGDTYLLNLTFATPLDTNLAPETIFRLSRAPFKLLVPGHFTVFSPEPFVRIEGSRIFSHPMKGTIDANLPGAEQRLLDDRKEYFEHNTIVDLIRNDLSMVSTQVRVERFRYLERVVTHRGDILQASSVISGELPAGWRDRTGDILFTLLPAGSVTGAPKERTVEIIRAAEADDRGFYTGIFGRMEGGRLESAVAIRFIEQRPNGLVFRSGGGITALSNADEEYREMTRKVYLPVRQE